MRDCIETTLQSSNCWSTYVSYHFRNNCHNNEFSNTEMVMREWRVKVKNDEQFDVALPKTQGRCVVRLFSKRTVITRIPLTPETKILVVLTVANFNFVSTFDSVENLSTYFILELFTKKCRTFSLHTKKSRDSFLKMKDWQLRISYRVL